MSPLLERGCAVLRQGRVPPDTLRFELLRETGRLEPLVVPRAPHTGMGNSGEDDLRTTKHPGKESPGCFVVRVYQQLLMDILCTGACEFKKTDTLFEKCRREKKFSDAHKPSLPLRDRGAVKTARHPCRSLPKGKPGPCLLAEPQDAAFAGHGGHPHAERRLGSCSRRPRGR